MYPKRTMMYGTLLPAPMIGAAARRRDPLGGRRRATRWACTAGTTSSGTTARCACPRRRSPPSTARRTGSSRRSSAGARARRPRRVGRRRPGTLAVQDRFGHRVRLEHAARHALLSRVAWSPVPGARDPDHAPDVGRDLQRAGIRERRRRSSTITEGSCAAPRCTRSTPRSRRRALANVVRAPARSVARGRRGLRDDGTDRGRDARGARHGARASDRADHTAGPRGNGDWEYGYVVPPPHLAAIVFASAVTFSEAGISSCSRPIRVQCCV